METDDRRAMWNGFGDGLARAFQLVVTPAIFGLLGHLLDRRLDLTPLFLVSFALLALAWEFAKTWMGYEAAMRRQDAAAPWAPRRREGVDEEVSS